MRYKNLWCLSLLALNALHASVLADTGDDNHRVVDVSVSWLEEPIKRVVDQGRSEQNYVATLNRDAKSEAELFRALRKTLSAAGIGVQADASVVVEIEVRGGAFIRQYRDTLFGKEANRPAKYNGAYVVRVLVDDEQVAFRQDDFSFTSSYSAGRTSTKISKVKVIGLVDKWLAKFIRKRKFKKLLPAQS